MLAQLPGIPRCARARVKARTMGLQCQDTGSIYLPLRHLSDPRVDACILLATWLERDPETQLMRDRGPVVLKARLWASAQASTAGPGKVPAELVALRRMSGGPGHGHPNVVRLLGAMHDEEYLFMILPHYGGGDLLTAIDAAGGRGLGEEEACHVLVQIAQGLMALKEHGIAHG
jgi:serine/threonine protein kinase